MKRITLLFLITLIFFSCKKEKQVVPLSDLALIKARDTLVVGTLYGSSSYFTFKGEDMGFDYELCAKFAEDQGLALKVVVASSEPDLITMLKNGQVDLIAYRLSIRNDLKKDLLYTSNEYINNQVLIQRGSTKMISNVVDLIGKEVYVLPGTKYEERLVNLNAEIGGGIIIKKANDSLNVDNLIEMVSNGTIDYTVAENDVASLNKIYFQNIDCKIPVSFNQRSAWAVSKNSPLLQKAINKWLANEVEKAYSSDLYDKYFERSKFFGERKIHIPKGAVSPYDKLFKKYAKQLKWNWMLLAAQSYSESKFDSSAVSWSGARGLMQIMPRTAAIYGLDDTSVSNPEDNIEAATRYLKSIDACFCKVSDKEERLKFVLAAYNAGTGNVLDAMALAEKYGKNPYIWFDNAEECMLLKSRKEYYSDPVVKHGYFRGVQTYRYVRDVLARFEKYKKRK